MNEAQFIAQIANAFARALQPTNPKPRPTWEQKVELLKDKYIRGEITALSLDLQIDALPHDETTLGGITVVTGNNLRGDNYLRGDNGPRHALSAPRIIHGPNDPVRDHSLRALSAALMIVGMMMIVVAAMISLRII